MKNQSTYYGGFFWLALTSFVVPLFVAYAAFTKITPASKPTPVPDASGVDHNLWDYLLRNYVENGMVDYEGISKDYLFTTYLRQIASARPDQLATREQRLALHCNAYNALVINGVITHKIHRNEKNVLNYTPGEVAAAIHRLDREIEALKRRPQSDPAQIDELMKEADQLRADSHFFRLQEHLFANQTISLDHLEQVLIRPVFQEPRIHVALVCAAISCPAIRPEAYFGDRIEQQLEDQSRQFANNKKYVKFDAADNSLHLSPILSWYSADWEASGGYLTWLHSRVEDEVVRQKLLAAEAGSINVKLNHYDWSLNSSASSSSSSGASTSSGFGSGSVPNE